MARATPPSRSGSSTWRARACTEVRPNLKKRDLELVAGAQAHFEDPAYYAQTYESRTDDVLYYRAVAMKHGSVLELGVGNGRVALPLARSSVHVTGIDPSRPMLQDLRRRLRAESPDVRRRVTLRRGDMRTTRLRRRFPLVICPFNAALHLYVRTDVEQWLARAREHLEPRGELVFDISMPLAKDLARNPSVPYRMPPFHHPSAGRVTYYEHFDYDPVRQILFVSMFFEPIGSRRSSKGLRPKGGLPNENPGFMTPLAHRQFFPCEMEALLHYNDFDVTALYGDFERGPLLRQSDVMVWHARPKRSAR